MGKMQGFCSLMNPAMRRPLRYTDIGVGDQAKAVANLPFAETQQTGAIKRKRN
jgi:hypothetical protein